MTTFGIQPIIVLNNIYRSKITSFSLIVYRYHCLFGYIRGKYTFQWSEALEWYFLFLLFGIDRPPIDMQSSSSEKDSSLVLKGWNQIKRIKIEFMIQSRLSQIYLCHHHIHHFSYCRWLLIRYYITAGGTSIKWCHHHWCFFIQYWPPQLFIGSSPVRNFIQ